MRILVILFVFSLVSCSKYYQVQNQWTQKENYVQFQLNNKKNIGDFNAYNDYHKDTIQLEMIYLTPKEMRKVKNLTLKGNSNSHTIFLHNQLDYYINVSGLFYPKTNLTSINFDSKKVQRLSNGYRLDYEFGGKRIVDFYIENYGGLMRYIAVENPILQKSNPDRLEVEIDYLFFTLNSNLFKYTNQN